MPWVYRMGEREVVHLNNFEIELDLKLLKNAHLENSIQTSNTKQNHRNYTQGLYPPERYIKQSTQEDDIEQENGTRHSSTARAEALRGDRGLRIQQHFNRLK